MQNYDILRLVMFIFNRYTYMYKIYVRSFLIGLNETIYLEIGEQVTITSPNYPYDYPNNYYKLWEIIPPSELVVLLQFTEFRLESCCDYLEVYSGDDLDSSSSSWIAHFSGSGLPNDMIISGAYLWLEFSTDSSVTYTGFLLDVSAVNTTGKF